MRSHTALSTSLVSLMIILAGVLLVIFIQFDRGYAIAGTTSVSYDEQMQLLDKVYQLNQQQSSGIERDKTTTVQVNNNAQVVQQHPLAFDFASPYVRNTSVTDEFDQLYILRNNPWSPNYQPPGTFTR